MKILGAVLELPAKQPRQSGNPPIQPIHLKIGPNWQNQQCCLAGSSKMAHRIFIFSIVMGADQSFICEIHGLQTPREEIAFTAQPKI